MSMGPMGMGPMGAGGGAQMGPMPGLTSGEGGNFHLGPGGQWTGEGGDNGKHQPGMRRHSGFFQPIRHLSGRTQKSLFWKQSGLSHVVRKRRSKSLLISYKFTWDLPGNALVLPKIFRSLWFYAKLLTHVNKALFKIALCDTTSNRRARSTWGTPYIFFQKSLAFRQGNSRVKFDWVV